MPIYAYACSACGLQQDTLQKLSDAPLSVCPECGKATFTKQLTAAGFLLKGNGYYVTDFKNGATKAQPEKQDVPENTTAKTTEKVTSTQPNSEAAAVPAPAVKAATAQVTNGAA